MASPPPPWPVRLLGIALGLSGVYLPAPGLAAPPKAPPTFDGLAAPPKVPPTFDGLAAPPKVPPTFDGVPSPSKVPPTFYIAPLGPLEPAHAALACATIIQRFAIPCQVLRSRPLPRQHLSVDRGQYDADGLIDTLFARLPDDGLGILGLTNADLFDARRPRFVFGLASLVDRAGVVSLARLRDTWWGDDLNQIRFLERFDKLATHEAGHTLGLPHCDQRRCVMRDDATLAGLDTSPKTLCPRCQAGAWTNRPGTARGHARRGHAHLRRGQLPQAVYHLELAAWLTPDDGQAANDLGVAYLRRGDGGRALWWLRHARALAPQLPHAPFNEGLIYLSVGDHSRAQRAFEAALEADDTFALAHRQLGLLNHEHLARPAQALAHYERYLALDRGQDRDIEARIRLIKGGGSAQP